MKRFITAGLLALTSLITVSIMCATANKSPIISFAGVLGNNYSVTFNQSSIYDDTFCGEESGMLYLSSKVNTTNDMLNLSLSYAITIDDSVSYNQHGKILRYDVTSSWDGEFNIYVTLWGGISNFTSIELNGSFTDIEDNTSSKVTYVESKELVIDLDENDNWTLHLSDCIYTIFDLTSITINYTC